jgi:hypothetical protein
MPLLDLRTDLKSLKYGADRLGGGDSGLPYIQTNVERANPGIKFDDGLVRGGTVNAAVAGAIDTARIAKFLIDPPKGPLFIVKQVGLQLSNPRLEVPKNPANIASGLPDNVLSVGTNGLLQPTRIYNLGINTLAQIPVNAFGAHFNRHGLLPVQTNASKYEAIVTANNDLGGSSKFNRLVGLTNKFKLGDRTPNLTISNRVVNTINAITQAINLFTGATIRPVRVNPQDLIIDQYAAGPNSVYGIGRTTINRYYNSEDSFKIDTLTSFSRQYAGKTRNQTTGAPQSVDFAQDKGTGPNAISTYPDIALGSLFNVAGAANSINASLNLNAVNYSNPTLKKYSELQKQIKQQQELQTPLLGGGGTLFGGVSVVRGVQPNQFGIYNTNTGTYSSANVGKIVYENSYKEKVTINISNWNQAAREQRIGSGRQDLINLTPIFDESSYYGNDYINIGGDRKNIRDLVRFRIQAVDTESPDKGKWMVFRAYLSGLSDDTTPEWTDIKYAGRGEKFYIYNGFTRKINLTFKIAALSKEEMKFIYSKLNFLMSNTMPDYKGVLMRGPLVRMSVGSWLDSQLGKIDSLSLKVPDDSPWEISLDEPEGGAAQLILPHVVEVTMTFTPIGAESRGANLIPEKSTYTSYIAQNNTGKDVSTLQYVDPVPVVTNTNTTSTPTSTPSANTPPASTTNTNTNNNRAQQVATSRTNTNKNNNLVAVNPNPLTGVFPNNIPQQQRQTQQPAVPTTQVTPFFRY